MTKEDMKKAASAAIDALFERPEQMPVLTARLAEERERVKRMIETEAAGTRTFLSTGDLGHTERNWPCISSDALWPLVTRGSDILAGSVKAGYAARHPGLKIVCG